MITLKKFSAKYGKCYATTTKQFKIFKKFIPHTGNKRSVTLTSQGEETLLKIAELRKSKKDVKTVTKMLKEMKNSSKPKASSTSTKVYPFGNPSSETKFNPQLLKVFRIASRKSTEDLAKATPGLTSDMILSLENGYQSNNLSSDQIRSLNTALGLDTATIKEVVKEGALPSTILNKLAAFNKSQESEDGYEIKVYSPKKLSLRGVPSFAVVSGLVVSDTDLRTGFITPIQVDGNILTIDSKVLKAFMSYKGLNSSEVSKKLKISKRTVDRWRAGQNKTWKTEHLTALVKVLKVSCSEIPEFLSSVKSSLDKTVKTALIDYHNTLRNTVFSIPRVEVGVEVAPVGDRGTIPNCDSDSFDPMVSGSAAPVSESEPDEVIETDMSKLYAPSLDDPIAEVDLSSDEMDEDTVQHLFSREEIEDSTSAQTTTTVTSSSDMVTLALPVEEAEILLDQLKAYKDSLKSELDTLVANQ